MEYAKIKNAVDNIHQGKVEDVYADLMANEKDSIKIAERIADDIRYTTIERASLWHTSLSHLATDYVAFVQKIYGLFMLNKTEEASRLLLSPDGLISSGITILIVAILLSLLRI
jgi:hypothetical protein